MRAAVGALLLCILVAGAAGCSEGTDPDESVAGVLEHFCQYEADSEDETQECFDGGGEKLLLRQEWGPHAQAMLYALGEVKGCLSKAGSECEAATWTVDRKHSLLVERYCAYGSETAAQLGGCLAHVRKVEVLARGLRTLPTEAGSYAVGDRVNCGYSAGPFCGGF